LITVLENNFFAFNRGIGISIFDFTGREQFSFGGCGDERPPAEEIELKDEAVSSGIERRRGNVFLCDIVLKHGLGEDLARQVIEATYYRGSIRHNIDLDAGYAVNLINNAKEHTQPLKDMHPAYATPIFSTYTSIGVTPILIYGAYGFSNGAAYEQAQEYEVSHAQTQEYSRHASREDYNARIQMVPLELITRETQMQEYVGVMPNPVFEAFERGTQNLVGFPQLNYATNQDILVDAKKTEQYSQFRFNLMLEERMPRDSTEIKLPNIPEVRYREVQTRELTTNNNVSRPYFETVNLTVTRDVPLTSSVNESGNRLEYRATSRIREQIVKSSERKSIDSVVSSEPRLSEETRGFFMIDEGNDVISSANNSTDSGDSDNLRLVEPSKAGQVYDGKFNPLQSLLGRIAKEELTAAKKFEREIRTFEDNLFYRQNETRYEKKCADTSNCFAEITDWLEGKESMGLTKQQLESLSQCYSEQIRNIQKAREYIKQRRDGYACGGRMRHLFHHSNPSFRLKDYVRNGEAQEGFKLAEAIEVRFTEEDMKSYTIRAFNTKTGQIVEYHVEGDSLYAYLDRHLRGTMIWKDFSFIDTDNGKERSGVYTDEKTGEIKACLYLETIAEYHLEAKRLLGDRDNYGMKLNGIIILVNGVEPGNGTTSLFNYRLKKGDIVEIIYKNDQARYSVRIAA
jgi:hypothetical protein